MKDGMAVYFVCCGLSLAPFAAMVVSGCDSCCEQNPGNKVPPDLAIREFAQKLNLPVAGTDCAQIDTDNDGYVTCTLSIAGDRPRVESVQCAALGAGGLCNGMKAASGCKMTTPKVNVTTTGASQ